MQLYLILKEGCGYPASVRYLQINLFTVRIDLKKFFKGIESIRFFKIRRNAIDSLLTTTLISTELRMQIITNL